MIIDEHTYNIGFHLNVLFYFILIQNQNWNRQVCYIRVCLSRCVRVSNEQLPHQLILPKAFFLSTILSPMKSIYNCHFRMLNWKHRLISESLAGPAVTRERDRRNEMRAESAGRMSEVEACPVCRARLLPALSEPEWLTMTSRYQLSWSKMAAAARHISIPPLAPHNICSLHPHTDPSLRCRRDVPRLMMQIQALQKSLSCFTYPFIGPQKYFRLSPICNTLLCRRHYVHLMYLLVSTVPSEMTKHQN